MHEIISTVRRDYIAGLASQNKRVDGRTLDQFRELSVETGLIKSAQGSALAKLGNAQMLVGVKLEHIEPFPDSPSSGVLMVNAELLPLASPIFEPGPPKENAIELARVVDRAVRESKTIDLDKLGIKPGEDAWCVYVDVYVLDHDGNLIDAAVIATIAALLKVKLPEDPAWTLPEFPMTKKPLAVTVAKVNGKLMVDPNLEEENAMDARITISTLEDGSVCAIQKGGDGCFRLGEVEAAYELSRKCGAELRKSLG